MTPIRGDKYPVHQICRDLGAWDAVRLEGDPDMLLGNSGPGGLWCVIWAIFDVPGMGTLRRPVTLADIIRRFEDLRRSKARIFDKFVLHVIILVRQFI